MKNLEAKVDNLAVKVDTLSTNLDDLAEIVKVIADKMVTKEEFNDRFDKLEFRIGGHDNRISNLEDKIYLISKKIGLSN
jgi:hypothetical protein